MPIPKNYPVVGDDAFRTGTGVHAAAVIKAYRKNDVMLANSIYSGVPSHFFGMEQIIEIGPMSGKSNVQFWLERHGIPDSEELVDRIYPARQELRPHADRRRDHGVRAGAERSAVGAGVVTAGGARLHRPSEEVLARAEPGSASLQARVMSPLFVISRVGFSRRHFFAFNFFSGLFRRADKLLLFLSSDPTLVGEGSAVPYPYADLGCRFHVHRGNRRSLRSG